MIYNNEAEQAVIASVLLDMVTPAETGLTSDHFGVAQHQLIWRICLDLDEKSIKADVITVGNEIEDDQLAEYLLSVIEDGRGVSDVHAYCDIIRNNWKRREISKQSIALSMEAETGDLDKLLADADSITEKLESTSLDLAPQNKKALKAHIKDIDQRGSEGKMRGISTGSNDLDAMTRGMADSNLWIIAARPSMGKSIAMLDLVTAACDHGPVFVFSLEMPREDLYDRLLTAMGKINYDRVQDGVLTSEEWTSLAGAAARMSEWELRIDDRAGLTPAQVRAACRLYSKQSGKPRAIFVDYLQLMSSGKKHDNKTVEVGYISNQLKELSKEFKCPVVALSQLNRGVEQRPDKRPRLSDLRESGNIEQDGDVIIMLYREEMYNPDNSDTQGLAEWIIVKQRKGQTGTIHRSFVGRHQTFKDLYRGDA